MKHISPIIAMKENSMLSMNLKGTHSAASFCIKAERIHQVGGARCPLRDMRSTLSEALASLCDEEELYT
jgi:hypothetical protein